MMMKKILVCLLALLILGCSVLISCTDPSEDAQKTPADEITEDPNTDNDGQPSEGDSPVPEFPDTIKGNGESIVIQIEGWSNYTPLDVIDIGITEKNNENINDAAFNRDRQIEEALAVAIEPRKYGTYQESQAKLTLLVNSGDCDVDFCLMRSAVFTSAIAGNLLSDLNAAELVYFNPDNPWWDRNSYDSLSIANIHYGITGDFTTADDLTYWCVFFNKQIIDDFSLESPYEIVQSGEWTYDVMFEMGEVVAADLDDVDGPSYDDRHGVSMIRDILCGALNTAGVTIIEKDKEDLPVLTFYNEENVNKMLDLLDLFYNTDICYNVHIQGGNEVEIFTNGNTLFTMGGIYYGPDMRNADVEFGMLPMPKYDEYQEYISATSPLFLTVLCTPKSSTTDGELKSAFMELYSYLGSEIVVPEFHDRLIKYKVARDEESKAMLSYIFDNTVYDVGGLFNFADITYTICDMMYTYNRNVASMWGSKETQVQEAINTLLNGLE